MAPRNQAAWIMGAKSHPFQVKEAPMWTPGSGEILVRNSAAAINPVDGSLQTSAFWPLNYPAILGQDVAGQVVAVGADVTRFREGDRVLGHALGMATKRNQDSGFQLYTILQSNMASQLPANVSFESACVLPLACSTAAAALFQDSGLRLQLPTEPRQPLTGKTVLVWGGSSSLGSNAIQLAAAAGYEVITTASPKNFDYVKRLGASQVFDYQSSGVQENLVNAFQGKSIAGALDCIGGPSWQICMYVVQQTAGNKVIISAKRGFPEPLEGVTIKGLFGTSVKDSHVGKAIYEGFLPQALESGSYVPAPEPLVVGKGLNSIQDAVDFHRKGVSASKVVVTL
ncbi:zinc-binding oxidoreductase CipB [Ustulina deusta]|nr:zinc-binding oxidoreductase CipB [Ustulina deusta]